MLTFCVFLYGEDDLVGGASCRPAAQARDFFQHGPSVERPAAARPDKGEADARRVDVLVVGARVAGSMLAALLGGEGWSVFRGSGCGALLKRLGLLEDVLALGPPPLLREYNADALTGVVSIDPPQDPGDVG